MQQQTAYVLPSKHEAGPPKETDAPTDRMVRWPPGRPVITCRTETGSWQFAHSVVLDAGGNVDCMSQRIPWQAGFQKASLF